MAERGAPVSITVDNGPEFYSRAMEAWAYHGIFGGAMHTPPAGLIAFEPRPNLVVARTLDLIAGLLRCQHGLGGIPYWAVGSGDPAWDANAPPPDRCACALHHEIFRKRIDPGQINSDPGGGRIWLRRVGGRAARVTACSPATRPPLRTPAI